jgi:putative endonuclease
MNKIILAHLLEEYSVFYLISLGYEILSQNWHSSAGEIDILAYRAEQYCFIEVRGRKAGGLMLAEESLSEDKLERCELTALVYLEKHPEIWDNWQIAFLALTYDQKLQVTRISFEENLLGF